MAGTATPAGTSLAVGPAASLRLSQSSTASDVGVDVTIVATFEPGPFGGPFDVTFVATGAGPTRTSTDRLNTQNRASWTYHRSSDDIARDTADRISASVDIGDGIEISATPIEHTWRVPVVVALSLSPSSGTSPVGGTATVIATVSVNGRPASGVKVDFSAQGTAGARIATTVVTTSSGAPFAWSRTAAGSDSVVA